MATPRVRRPRSWAKHHLDWYSSPQHQFLSGDGHAIGPLLEVLGNRSRVWGRISPIDGHSVAETCAKYLHWTVERADAAIDELARVGTLRRARDGSVHFPNFSRWQETPDAERKRVARGSQYDSDDGGGDEVSGQSGDIMAYASDSGSISGSEGGAGGRPPRNGIDHPINPFGGAPPSSSFGVLLSQPVLEVWSYYRNLHPRAPFNPDREVAARVTELLTAGFSAASLCKAIDGAHANDFNRGRNRDGRTFLGLLTILKNVDVVTKHLEAAEEPEAVRVERAKSSNGLHKPEDTRPTGPRLGAREFAPKGET